MGGWIPVVVLKSGIRFVVGDSWSLRFTEVADLLNRENQEGSQSSLLDPHSMILLQIEAGVSHDIPAVRIYRSTGKPIEEVAVATGFAVSAERLKTTQFSFSKDKKKIGFAISPLSGTGGEIAVVRSVAVHLTPSTSCRRSS